jgi:RimJ/RimL family protein N-acetyltransferase
MGAEPGRLEPTFPLRTERLVLRPFEPGDLAALFDIYSRDEVVTYLYEDAARTLEEVRPMLAERMIRRAIVDEGDKLSLAALLASTGELVGDVICAFRSREHLQGEIGFVVHPEHQGRGYASEVSVLLLDLMFRELKLHRVVGRAEARNAASARVLEKLGMRREAHLVENEYVKDEWQSELVYAILDREWLSRER